MSARPVTMGSPANMVSASPEGIEASAVDLRAHAAQGALLVSDTRCLAEGDWLLARPSARTPLTTLLALAQESAAAGVVFDASLLADAESWVSRPLPAALAAPMPALQLWPVEGLAKHAGHFAAAFYGHPSRQMSVVAVTGTNGKSSITQAHAAAWHELGEASAALGTLGPVVLGARWPSQHRLLRAAGAALTTPDAVTLQACMRLMLDSGVRHLAIEASSIGLVQGRLQGTELKAVALASLGQDHLDFHKTLDAYDQAKALLFGMAPGAVIAPSIEPQRAERFRATAQAHGAKTIDLVQPKALGLLGLDDAKLPRLLGQVNRENRAVLAGLLHHEGLRNERLQRAVSAYRLPEGRFEAIALPGTPRPMPQVWVDYAHTPDGLVAVCQAAREALALGGRLLLVFGCGGDRDADKRPRMAALAAELADTAIITNDNPRSEAPEDIAAQMLAGLRPHHRQPWVILDRARAIRAAIRAARNIDLVVIAGKGHEKTQTQQGTVLPFSDQAEARTRLAEWLPPLALEAEGRPVESFASTCFTDICTDTRKLEAGALFLALRGETHDAHSHLAQAVQAGAQGLVVEVSEAEARTLLVAQGLPEAQAQRVPIWSVPSTLHALAGLAAQWRRQWPGQMAVVVGSNGKTTTKELLAAMAKTALGDAHVCATQGNLNNQVGLPISLLRLTALHQMAIMEIGMNHPGEIAALAEAAAPDVVVMTNAQREHLEFMQNVAQCAEENGTALLALPTDKGRGLAVLPNDPEHGPIWLRQLAGRPHREFATPEVLPGMPMVARIPPLTEPVRLQGMGLHFAENAAAAAMAADALGIPSLAIAEALESFEPVAGRGRIHTVGSVRLVDDSYNANPDSMAAALNALSVAVAHNPDCLSVAVLGDMGELGAAAPAAHAEVVRQAIALKPTVLAFAGQAFGAALRNNPSSVAFSTELLHADGAAALLEPLCAAVAALQARHPSRPLFIWIKGSRFMRMESLIPPLLDLAHPTPKAAHHAS